MGAEEVPDTEWVRLLRGFRGDLLVHNGTGEFSRLDGNYSLAFDEEGFGFVEPLVGHCEALWAGEIFRSSLQTAHRSTAGKDEHFIDTPGGASRWRQDMFDTECRSRAWVADASMNDVRLEAFVSELPRGDWCVRWSLPFFLDRAVGSGFAGDYICRHIPDWKRLLEQANVDASGIRQSQKSYMDSCRKSGVPIVPSMLTSFDREFSVSTSAMVVLSCHFGYSTRMKVGNGDQQRRSCEVISALMAKFAKGGPHLPRFTHPGDESEVVLSFDGDSLNLPPQESAKARRVLPDIIGDGTHSVAAFLAAVYAKLRRSSRLAGFTRALLQSCFTAIVMALECEVEASKRDNEVWGSSDHLALPVLRRDSQSSRTRRVSPALKILCQNEVASTDGIRTSAQLLAAQQILSRGKRGAGGDAGKGFAKRTAERFHEAHCAQYMVAMQRSFAQQGHLWFVCDGCRVSNTEMLVVAVGDPSKMVHGWAAPQVLWDCRLREATPGTALNAEEEVGWASRSLSFTENKRKHSQISAAASQREAKLQAKKPRLATFDWQVALHSSLKSARGDKGLAVFAPPKGEEDRRWDDELREGESLPPFVVGVCDEEQKQWSGIAHMRALLKLALEVFPDNFHRRSNDVWRALAKSGMATWSLLAMLVCNIAYGPWCKGKNYNEMIELAHEVAVSTADDPILIRLWGRVVRDKGAVDMQADAREGRSEFLKGLLASNPAKVKGPKTAPSRFFSINHGWRFWRSTLHTKCYCLVHLAKEKGWCSSWEDLFTTSTSLKNALATPEESDPQPASSKDAPRAPVVSVSKAKEAGRQKMNTLIKKSKNSLHAVTRILCDSEFVTNMDIVAEFTKPLESEHNHFAKNLKDSASVKAYFESMALGEWLKPLQESVQRLGQLSALGVCGFQTVFPSEVREKMKVDDPAVLAEDTLAKQTFSLVLNLLTERCWSMSTHLHCCPELFAPINSSDEKRRTAAMEAWPRAWEAYAAAKHQKGSKVEELVKRSTLNSRSMEICSRFARAAGWKCDEKVKEIGHVLFGHFGHSLMCERANQKIRDAEKRDSASGTVASWKTWGVPFVSKLMGAHDRPEVEPTMDMAAPRIDGNAYFKPTNEDAKDMPFATVMQDKGWVSLDAKGRRKLAVEAELLAYLKQHQCWEKIDDVWRSALLPVHQIVMQRSDTGAFGSIFMVLAVTDCGALTWPVHRLGGGANMSFALEGAGGKCEWKHIFSLEKLFVCPHTIISPLHCVVQGDVRGSRVGIGGNLENPVPLVEWQSRRGWAGVAESLLVKLSNSLKVKLPDPHPQRDYEVDLALGVMEQFLPDWDEKSANEYIRCRAIVGESEADNAEVLEQFATSDMIEDVAGRSEKKFCGDLLNDAKKCAKRREELNVKITASVAEKFPKKGRRAPKVTKEAKALKVSASGPADKRWWNTIRGDPSFLLKHAPGVGNVCTDDDNGRFLLTYPNFSRKSVSWTVRGCNKASLECLRWWWQYHTQATGVQPPPELVEMWA